MVQNFYQDIGMRIRTIRLHKQISQEKLAAMAGFSSTHMSHIENGSTKLSVDALIRISNALEVNADSILCDCLVYAGENYRKEIEGILQGCDDKQTRVIAEVAKTLQMALERNYGESAGEV